MPDLDNEYTPRPAKGKGKATFSAWSNEDTETLQFDEVLFDSNQPSEPGPSNQYDLDKEQRLADLDKASKGSFLESISSIWEDVKTKLTESKEDYETGSKLRSLEKTPVSNPYPIRLKAAQRGDNCLLHLKMNLLILWMIEEMIQFP